MTEARVSAIIPLFNGERFLSAALDSVLAQTRPPFEVLVIDDGSTDGGPRLARTYPEVRVLHQTNAGNAAARNAGIAAATGDLLAFLDADDMWTPNKLELQVAHMVANPHLGYTLAHLQTFVEPGVEPPSWLRPELLEGAVPGPIPSTLVARRWTFDRVGLFDPRHRIAVDVDWLLRAREAGVPSITLQAVLLRRRIHEGNLSADPEAQPAALLRVIRASVLRQRASGSERPR